MVLFSRRGHPRLGNGFRPAFYRYGEYLMGRVPPPPAAPKSASVAKAFNVNSASVQELKDYMDANGIDRTGLTLKADLIAAINAV